MILGLKYNEIMDRLQVTDAMRARVLARLERPGQRSSVFPHALMLRRALAAAACLAVILAGASLLPRFAQQPRPSQTPSGPVTGIPGFQDFPSAQALSQQVGFPVSDLKELPFLVERSTYTAYGQTMAQIRSEGEEQWALFRKWAGTEDNSGDYTVYTVQASCQLNGLAVTLKGNAENAYGLALWTDGSYTCSLSLSQPLTEAQWSALISANS